MGGYGMAAKMRELTEQNMQEFVKEVEKRKIPLHSVLIAQHGNLLFEKYYAPYCRNKLQRMFSVTKSFTSLAIGLLEQEGKISLQDPICDYFPEYLPGRVHPWLAEMTIENMLKMQTCYNMTTYNKTSTTENWVRSFFQTEPTHRPGTLFMYDTSSSHTLCALVEKLTGEKMLDYLKEKLLRQIGFSEESYIIEDPFGTSMGGSGLMATPEDLLRTGCMLLKQEKGSYAARATEPRTATQLDGDDRWYGYQFWIPMEGTFAMLGLGGIINVAAPYYLVIYTEDKERADMNAGYIMQQISLYLFSKGVGSCFQGMGHLKGEMPKEGMRCVILMAIGYPKVDMVRNQEDAKRESMEDLCAVKEPPRRFVKEFLEVARLAPSAFNSQPWRFVVYENRVHVFSKQTVAHRRLLGKYNEFDFGIMLANIMIAAEQLWVDVDLIRLDNITHMDLPNNRYVISIIMREQ